MSLIDADGQGTFKFALGGRPEEEYVMATPAEPMRFTEDIYITGKLSGDDLARLAPTYGSWIYLATDEEGDSALPGGFQALSAYPQLHATHAPLNMKNLTLAQADAAVAAVEAGPRPTLVQCMSGGRAGAVALMYEAKKQHWTVEQAMTYAQENKLMFVKNAAVVDLVTAYVAKCQSRPPVLFRQLYELETSTYTYLLADPQSKEAILIDPVDVTVDRDLQFVQELGLTLTLAVNTHCHADHVTGTGLLKQKCPGVRSVIAATSGAKADMHVKDGDLIRFGRYAVECRATPGHTAGCMSYVMDDRSMCFTGDALFVRGCGRTDFQQGSAPQLYESIMTKLYTLPGETLVYPGHDYKGRTVSTIEEEKRWNPRLTKGLEGFVHIMDNLNLAYPKKIDEALPKNLQDGITLPTEPQA